MRPLLKYFLMFIGILSFSIIPFDNAFSARIILPNATRQGDVNISSVQIDNWIANEQTLLWYVKIINTYLRFSIWAIAMATLMYAGIQLITAWWDKAKVSKAWKMALYSLIWIFVAIVSYTIINLIVNLV